MKQTTTLEKIQKESEDIRQIIQEKTLGHIITALGLIAGLAWNEAIKSLIEVIFPTKSDGLLAKLVYAVIITLFIVIISAYLTKLFKKR